MDATAATSVASPATPTTLADLPDDPVVLQRMIRELLATLHDRDRELAGARHRLDQLLRRLYGPRAEKIDPNQLLLFAEAAAPAPAPPEPPPAPPQPAPAPRAGHGRRRLPRDLPRQTVVHELPQAERACPGCGQERLPIGREVSEQLDYKPASLFVVENVRVTYACAHCEAHADSAHVATAPKPAVPLERALPGPGLLAQAIVDKYVDHLPLHRQEHRFERQGLVLARSTLCDWMAAAAGLLLPLYERLKELVLQSRVIQTDDTPVPVQDRERDHTRQGYLWTYLGDRDHPYTVFDYTATHSRDGPEKFLGPFHGFLQADAHSVYDALFTRPLEPLTEVGCWAHARRYFWESRSSDPARAHAGIAWIGRLYEVEDRAGAALRAEATAAERDAVFRERRQAESVPLLADFRRWLEEQQPQVLPKSPIGEALRYALNHWTALGRYTEHGFLAIDNNASERTLRAVGIGRKNYLFFGSDVGGHTAAVLYSVAASCRRHRVEPWAYLRDVLAKLPTQPAERLDELLPGRWRATIENPRPES
jgi:transposase